MTDPIVLSELTHSYDGYRAVDDVSLAVRQGEIFGFLGPNGAGKTTAIRILMGLLHATSGAASVLGHDCWRERVAVKRAVGFLPGDIQLYEHMTGAETLEFFGSFRGRVPWNRIHQLAERFELDLSRPVRQLSKGNRQKVGIVQALMHDAPLLILDEPTSGLDPLKQHQFLEVLREEAEHGRTIFLSSHDLPEVEQIADRVGIIRRGQLIAVEQIETLRKLRRRTMQIRLREPVVEGRLEAIPGVSLEAVRDGREIELTISGEIQPVLQALAELPVEDLTYGPPDLESIFLHYYDESQLVEEEAVVQT